jgi:hypothetical protein
VERERRNQGSSMPRILAELSPKRAPEFQGSSRTGFSLSVFVSAEEKSNPTV